MDKKTEQILQINVFNGKAHDGSIFKNTVRINEKILVLADSGYRGIQKVHKNTKFPYRHAEDARHLTDEERKRYNKAISSRRMKIEHIIGKIKNFKIVGEKYRNHLKRFLLRIHLICGIVNYQNPNKLSIS